MKDRLESQGLHVQQMSAWSEDDCAAHSYGAVRDHFQNHPCRSLERAWYEICDDANDKAVVSAAWVRMPDEHQAEELHHLVDRPGTGNITELSKEDGPHGDVRYSGWYYSSDRSGDTFSSVQAEPLQNSDGSRDVAREASGTTSAD